MTEKDLSERPEQFVVVKNWHITIVVLTMLAGIILWAASVKGETEENTRDIQELKREELTRGVYDMGQRAVEQRLDRIEKKIDNADMREWKREGSVAGKVQ